MSMERTCETIAERLRGKNSTIAEAIFHEVRASVPDPVGDEPEYESGLYHAISDAVDYCIHAIDQGARALIPPPAATVEQAYRAARHGVGVETIVRRVALAERMMKAFATMEAGDLAARDLNRVLGSLDPAFDRIVRTVTEAHKMERGRLERGSDGRRLELTERLLAGERPVPADEDQLRYSFRGWHLGIAGVGPGVEDSLRQLGKALGCRTLFLPSEPISCWLGGGGRRFDFDDVQSQPAISRGADALFAVGEPGEGLEGWRRTHEQALLALLPGCQRSGRLTRATDVLPEAILSKDRSTARLLVATYLSPLNSLRRDGELARDMLRAFFARDRNVSATASALKIARGTVEHRLKEVEEAIGKPLCHEHMTRLELALRLEGELAGSLKEPPVF